MSDPLRTYLHDHLAGAKFAIDLLDHMVDQYKQEPLGAFADQLRSEIREDEAVLERLSDRVGDSGSRGLKDALAWLGEKGARLKLHRKAGAELGTLLTLEALSLAILGKRALWRVLAQIADQDSRLDGEDFHRLAERAETQFELVEERRLDAAWNTLSCRPTTAASQ